MLFVHCQFPPKYTVWNPSISLSWSCDGLTFFLEKKIMPQKVSYQIHLENAKAQLPP